MASTLITSPPEHHDVTGPTDRPLHAIASSFSALLAEHERSGEELPTGPFAEACDHISVLFTFLGMAFSFGGRDYIEKVKDLREAAQNFPRLSTLVEGDIINCTVRRPNSHTRNLLRVKRGLECMQLIFEHLLQADPQTVSLREAATGAYNTVFGPYHSWTIRKAVGAGMYTLPTKAQFLSRLKESDETWRGHAETYVSSVRPVIEYVERLFTSRDLGLDW